MQECVIHIWVSARKMLLLGVSNGVTTILRWYSFLFQIWCLTLNLIIGARTHTLSMGSNEWFYARIVKLHCLCTSDVIVLHQTWYNLFVMNGKKCFQSYWPLWGESTSHQKGSVMQSFDIFFDMWHHCNVDSMFSMASGCLFTVEVDTV